MYRRDCLLAVGGFDPSLKSCEDYDVYLRIAKAFPIACASDAIAEYRQHDMQKSRDSTRVLGAALAILASRRRLDGPNNNWLYKDASRAWKRWYATRHADQLINSLRRGTLSNQLLMETIRMLELAPLALLNALRSISKAKRRLESLPINGGGMTKARASRLWLHRIQEVAEKMTPPQKRPRGPLKGSKPSGRRRSTP